MTAAVRVWVHQDATWALRVALLLLLTTERSHGAYNCSRSLPPWIYINESNIKSGGQILYDGEPIVNISQSTLLRSYPFFGNPEVNFTANGGARLKSNFDIDEILSLPPPKQSMTYDYTVTCTGGESNSIAIVFVDENDEYPRFVKNNSSIQLSEDTCSGQEIYNFADKVEDVDFDDKPNEEKLQLVIIQSTPTTDTFSVKGGLGIWLNKPLNKNRSPHVLILTLRDQALHNANETFEFIVYVTPGLTRNSSGNTLKSCITFKTTSPGFFWQHYCSTRKIFVGIYENEVQIGRPIKFKGLPIQDLSTLTFFMCFYSKNDSLQFLGLADDGVLAFNTEFELDDLIYPKIGAMGIHCQYSFSCNAGENTTFNILIVFVIDENDEAPTFTPDSPKYLSIPQDTEFLYSFRGHVSDKDQADWPNDDRLELLIIHDLWDSYGTVVPGAVSVSERLALWIQPMLKASGSPYHLTVALKDHASNIGPQHNLTIYVTADGKVYCKTQTVNVSATRSVTLPGRLEPSFVELPCVSTGKPLLIARCERLGEDSPLAEYNVTLSEDSCSDNMSIPGLVDLYMVPVTESTILNVTMKIENWTSSYELQPADLSYVSRILENLTRFIENMNIEEVEVTNATELLIKVSPYVAGIVSNLMEAGGDVLEVARRNDSELTSRIIGSIDTVLLKTADYVTGNGVNTTAEELPVVQKQNIAYQIVTGRAIAGLVTCSLANGTTITVEVHYDSSTSSECLYLNGLPRSELKLSTAVRDVPRVFVVYTSAALFVSGATSESTVLSAQLTKTPTYKASAGAEHVVSLRQRLDQATVGQNGTLTCSYWNFSTSRWETDGCSLEPTEDEQGMFVCTCDHLTNFALLMLPCVGDCIGTVHDDVLGYVSLILLSISCVALVLVLVSFFAYRKHRQADAQKLTACLSASLLCMNALFIVGIIAVKNEAIACSNLAIALHYFLLTSFLFMTAEVILSYLRLAKVFHTHAPSFIWKVLAVCLGVPAVVVISIHFSDPELYVRSDQYCWVQLTLQIYGVVLPVGLAILFNLVMFILIARLLKIHQVRSPVSERKQTIFRSKALVAIIVVLGITWAFNILATIKASSVVFQYLFVISNSLQGLFVFIFHAVKAPVIARCRKNVASFKAEGFTSKENQYSDCTGRDVSLSSKTSEHASGSRGSIGAASVSVSTTTNN